MENLGLNLPSLVIFLVNFILLLGILYLFAYKPILRVMDQARGKDKGEPRSGRQGP